MPWSALPYNSRVKKDTLNGRYGIMTIPSLIILDKDGSIITSYGKNRVQSDPDGISFPWHSNNNTFLCCCRRNTAIRKEI